MRASRRPLTPTGGGCQRTARACLTSSTTQRRPALQPICNQTARLLGVDGAGIWADQDGDTDPCPLCEGTGIAPTGARADARVSEAALPRLLALLSRLSQPERQRLYEELHARYDCRIYRS